MKVLTLKIYCKSSPHPWILENVTNMATEGGLVRFTQNNSEDQWFPLCEIFRIVQIKREDKTR